LLKTCKNIVKTPDFRSNVPEAMRKKILSAACAGFALLFAPTELAAQPPVVKALVDLTDAIEGIHGDEGAFIAPAVDRLAQALTGSDASGVTSALQDGLSGAPLLPLAAYREAYARLAGGDVERAIAEFRNEAARDPLVTDPASRSASAMRAVTALRQGRLAEARSLLEQSGIQHESAESRRILGLVYWAASEYDRAAEQLDAAIRLDPKNERARLALARVLSSAEKNEAAIDAFLETIRAVPTSTRAHWWLAMAYERVNRFDAARGEYEKAAAGAVAGQSHLYGAIGRLASGSADVAGAVNAFERAVEARPNDPTWRTLLAGALLHQDRAEDAMAQFAAALRINPKHVDAYRGIGQIHLDAGRAVEAADALRRALELQPDDLDAQYALATALTRLGNSRDAARYFERVEQVQRHRLAEQRRTRSVDVLKEEAALRTAERDHERAAALWRQVIQLEPTHAGHQLGLAAALANAGQLDPAIEAYERGAALGAEPAVFRLLADLYARTGRAADAARARVMYEAALQQSGNNGR
jgi:tetratricopeptide (TPR) repeat protein